MCWLVDQDGRRRGGELLAKLAAAGRATDIPRFLLLTKSDQCRAAKLERRESAWGGIGGWVDSFRISAVTGEGIEALLAALRERFPERLFLCGGRPDRPQPALPGWRAGPRGVLRGAGRGSSLYVHVEVTEWREPPRPEDKTLIRATVYVERESQKGIVIGEGGRKLREIGRRARASIEALIAAPLFLELRVKVRSKWSRRDLDLEHFGYKR